MISITMDELAKGESVSKLPMPSRAQMLKDIAESDASAVDKLSAYCALDRSFLRTIHRMIVANAMEKPSELLSAEVSKDALVVKGGGFSASDSAAIDRASQAVLAVARFVSVADSDQMAFVGYARPTLTDLIESFSRVYQANYMSASTFSSLMCNKVDSLYALAFSVETLGFAVVLNVREKGRAIAKAEALAADTISKDATLDNPKD